MALSTPISLTAVRDFFGATGSINLTALHRGENNIIDVADTHGSSTVGKGSTMESVFGSAYAPSGSILTGSAYLNVGNHRPHAFYTKGGVCPSLSTANESIADSGSIDLTDYVGAYRKVNPTAGSISGSTSGSHGRGVAANGGATPTAYLSWFGGNYADLAANLDVGSTSNYCQIITVQSNQYTSSYSGSVTCSFTLSHAGIYAVAAGVTGDGGTQGSHYFNLSGTGVTVKTHVGETVSGDITLNAQLPTAFSRLFELHHTNTSSTITLTCGGTGGATQIQIRTNTNYLRHQNTNDTTVYNDMFTQS
tara:strand:+ start:253 stop:1173 length:921 start_codon:yes stop_codon:yes gene_type:complete